MPKSKRDVLTPEQRSYCMSRIKGRDTGVELMLRMALWHRGHRYRLRAKLPGKPDIVFIGARVAVFVDGCFWHVCPIHHTKPTTNADFWNKKLKANVARDKKINLHLHDLGWKVVRIWEHEINGDLASVVDKVERLLANSV